MKEAFEKLKERLEEESQYSCFHCMDRAIKIVSEVEAEYGNGKTNADRIRAMGDEEFAEYIFGVSEGSAPCVICSMDCDFCEATAEQCKEKTLNWLKSPTTD